MTTSGTFVTICDMTLSDYMQAKGLQDKQVATQLAVGRSCVTQIRLRTKQPSLDLAVRIIRWSEGAITPSELLKAAG